MKNSNARLLYKLPGDKRLPLRPPAAPRGCSWGGTVASQLSQTALRWVLLVPGLCCTQSSGGCVALWADVSPDSSVGSAVMLCYQGGELHATWAKIQGVYKSLSPRVHNIHENTRLATLWMSDAKREQLWVFSNLFFLPPPAADRWLDVLPRIHRLLLLLHRWAGTSQSVTPCDTLRLLVLWDQSNKWFQYCVSAGPPSGGLSPPPAVSPSPALRATVQVRRETKASSCATWKVSGKYVPPNPKACFCNPKVCLCLGEVLNNRASQSLVRFWTTENQQPQGRTPLGLLRRQ